MNLEHQFTDIQKTISDIEYRKCQRCGNIMFVKGDDYFNMICLSAVRTQEELRAALKATKGSK